MKQIIPLFCGLLLLFGPAVLRAQTEGGGDEGPKVPLGTEVRTGKLVFESANGDFKFWFDSRLQIDGAVYFEGINPLSNGTIMRRATFSFKTTLYRDWQAEIDLDFGDAVLDARDMWIKYTFRNLNVQLQVGNFKEPFGLERLTSSRMLTFLERSTPTNAFTLGRRMGFSARYWTNFAQVTLGVFGHELGTRVDKGTLDEGYSTNLRVVVAPVNEKGATLHIGGAASYKTPDVVPDLQANAIEVKARTETYVFDPKPLHTGDITDVNYYNRVAGELAGQLGPLHFESEYFGMRVMRWYGKPHATFGGGYATLSYVLTGETRPYFVDEGEFGPVDTPTNGIGAFELAVRYSMTDLNDDAAAIHGGKCNQLMLGLNWYFNSNFKVQFNYSKVALDQFATSKGRMTGGDKFSFLQVRFQASM